MKTEIQMAVNCAMCHCASNVECNGASLARSLEIQRNHIEMKLFAFAMTGEIKKLELLIMEGANVNAASVACNSPVYGKFGKNTALMFAAAAGKREAVTFLLRHGANPSIRNLAGETAYSIALMNNDRQMAGLLESAMERRRSSNDDNWDEKDVA